MTTSIIQLIQIEEGYREKAYYCSEGYPTIGTGHKIGPKGAPLEHYQFKISRMVDAQWLGEEVNDLRVTLTSKYPWFTSLNQQRKDIIISMCYQLGVDGFSKFKKTIQYLATGDFANASHEMLDSLWAKQTPKRAHRHSMVICVGDYDCVSEYEGILC